MTPTVVPGNPSCSHLNSGWTDFKPVDNNPNDEGDATPPPPPGGGDNGGGGDSGGGSNNTPPPSDTTPPSDASGKAPAADSGQAPAEEPGAQAVLGERIAGGTARRFSVSGCASRPFSARVCGRGISRVVFVLDGNRVATLHRPNRNGSYSLRINPARYRVGVHRLVVTVEFKPATRTASKTLRASFQRCASRLLAPRFTG